jgi:hypothetical protein
MLVELAGELATAGGDALNALAEAARRAVAAMRWDTPEGKWLLLRLVMALPFPEQAAAPGHGAVAALGALFDACRVDPSRLATPARRWVRWAAKHSARLAKARLEAYSVRAVQDRLRRAQGGEWTDSDSDSNSDSVLSSSVAGSE